MIIRIWAAQELRVIEELYIVHLPDPNFSSATGSFATCQSLARLTVTESNCAYTYACLYKWEPSAAMGSDIFRAFGRPLSILKSGILCLAVWVWVCLPIYEMQLLDCDLPRLLTSVWRHFKNPSTSKRWSQQSQGKLSEMGASCNNIVNRWTRIFSAFYLAPWMSDNKAHQAGWP